MLKKLIRANLEDQILCCGVVAGVFLVIQAVIGCVMYFGTPDTSLMISGVALPITAGFIAMIVTAAHVGVSFVQALQYGQTRRRALGLNLGLAGFETLCSMGLAALLTLAERAFAPGLWKLLSGADGLGFGAEGRVVSQYAGQGRMLFIENFSLDWWWFPAIALGGVALGMLTGAAIQRFGSRGFWLIWCAWMTVCFAPQLLSWSVIAGWLLPLMGALVLVALIWSVWSLLHAVVKH